MEVGEDYGNLIEISPVVGVEAANVVDMAFRCTNSNLLEWKMI